MKYETEEDIAALVAAFEAATLTRNEWRHADHIVVALYYVSRHDVATATDKMRSAILNLLKNGFGVDMTKEMPYHETMTVFWVHTVAVFNSTKNGESLVLKAAEAVEKFDKDYPLRFYSRELLFSDLARAEFVDGDLRSIDTLYQ